MEEVHSADVAEGRQLPVGELSHQLGYESEAAFSRAFKRLIGISPGAARRNSDFKTSRPNRATQSMNGIVSQLGELAS
jgi:AraC-like DNA-binding protein